MYDLMDPIVMDPTVPSPYKKANSTTDTKTTISHDNRINGCNYNGCIIFCVTPGGDIDQECVEECYVRCPPRSIAAQPPIAELSRILDR
ncbi:hypothetical protein ACH5RR_016728 [Cinchona calisaya]|uniref:Uncharacterized protein n=1 Tax=Cinchona calisaya TaxID=153742 RepID=A0ABD2ZXT8_9GENT